MSHTGKIPPSKYTTAELPQNPPVGTIVFDDMPLDESNTTNDNDEIPESVFD